MKQPCELRNPDAVPPEHVAQNRITVNLIGRRFEIETNVRAFPVNPKPAEVIEIR